MDKPKKIVEQVEEKVEELEKIVEKKTLLEKIKEKKKLWILVVVALFLIIGVVLVLSQFGEKNSFSELNETANGYSEDQQKVIEAFGLPQTFTITNVANLNDEAKSALTETESLEEDDVDRTEIWRYLYLGEVFIFDDGIFKAREHYDFGMSSETELVRVTVEPKQFYSIQEISEVNDLLSAEPNAIGELNQEIISNATVYSYDNLISIGVIDDIVVFVKTNAGYSGELEQTKTQLPEPEVSQTQNEGWKKGRIFSSDNEFSVFVDVPLANEIVLHEEILEETSYYLYCYEGQEENEDFLCDGDGFPLFIIMKYTPEAYAEFLTTPYADTETVLLENEAVVYTFSHPNGDPPAELADQITEIYQKVMDTFLLTNEME